MNFIAESDDGGKKIPVLISFDEYGKVYFELNNNNISEVYQLNLNNVSNPVLEKGEYKVLDKIEKKLRNFKIIKKNSLKNKIRKEIDEEKEKWKEDGYDIEEYDSDDDNDLDEEIEKINYYPEEDDIVEDDLIENSDDDTILDLDNIKTFGENNHKFNFTIGNVPHALNIPIYNREDGDVSALYDTYVYDNYLIFKSKSYDNSSLYVVKILLNGEIYFRTVYGMYKKYIIRVNNSGELQIVS